MEVIKMSHEEMKASLIENANLFYNGFETKVSDAVYDTMLKLVKQDEPEFNIYEHIKYTEDALQVPHKCEFRSFNKTADIASFETKEGFDKYRESYYVLPKFDGSSTVTYYNKDGSLDMILSRSDDICGFTQTNKLKNKVPNVAPGIDVQLAEAVVPLKDGGRAKANGMINSKYLQDDVDKYLTLIPFDYYMSDGTKKPNLAVEVTDWDVFCRIRDKGEFVYPVNGELYPCDGIVGYAKDGSETLDIHKLYFTEKTESEITSVSWEPAWTGIIHPVANFNTVVLDGTNVSRASLSNYAQCKAMHVIPGAHVNVIKANMTIPQITEVTDDVESEEFKAKELKYFGNLTCSYCGAKLREYGNNDVVCSSDRCSFWLPKILTGLYWIGHQEDLSEMDNEILWSVDKWTREFVHKLFTEDDKKKFESDIEVHLAVVDLPRLNEGKRQGIIDTYRNGTGVVDESIGITDPKSIKSAIYTAASWSQWWYYEKFIEVYEYISKTWY